MIERRY